jgi:hypothetical protein
MRLIETKTVGTAVATVEFTSIPQTYTDLVLLISSRPASGSIGVILAALNGSSANFTSRQLEGNGASATSGTSTTGRVGIFGDSGNTANTFANTQLYISNYTASTNKVLSADTVNETNGTTAYQVLYSTLWNNTEAITSIALTSSSAANWAVGSMVSLYGITKGSDGIVTTS